MHRARAAVFVVAAGGALLACGGGGSDAPELGATSAWARPTPAGADEGVVYLTVTSDRADAVEAASVPSAIAGGAELHETMVGGADGAHHHGGGGGGGDEMATMAPAEELAVDPATPLVFEPGGNHVMLVDLVAPLEAGERFVLTLELASGRSIDVPVVVQVNPPGS